MLIRKSVKRRGAIAVLIAFSILPLMAIAAIAIDGGLQQDYRRRVHAAADAAAIAAGIDLYNNYILNNGLDPQNTARASAIATAAANGFAADAASTITVKIPPTSGPFTGLAGNAEVIIQYNMPRGFSSVIGSGTLPIVARAVARGTWKSFGYGILLLDPTSQSSLNAGGNGVVTVQGGSVIVDSNNAQGAIANGGGTLIAPTFNLTGSPGYSTPGGGTFSGQINSNVSPTPDPLLYLPPPDPASMPIQSTTKKQISGGTKTLDPGVYQGGISISGSANVTLNPGIYYLSSGGFSYTGNASSSLIGNGVMIYNVGANSNDSISITGQGSVTFTPMTTGPYAGITLYQNRTSSASIKVAGGGAMNMTGTFYAAAATLDISGSAGNNTIGSQYISWHLNLGGGGNVNINYNAGSSRARRIGLVE